jgi:hypothetical protein
MMYCRTPGLLNSIAASYNFRFSVFSVFSVHSRQKAMDDLPLYNFSSWLSGLNTWQPRRCQRFDPNYWNIYFILFHEFVSEWGVAPLYLNNIKNVAIQGGPAPYSKMRRYYIAACVLTWRKCSCGISKLTSALDFRDLKTFVSNF